MISRTLFIGLLSGGLFAGHLLAQDAANDGAAPAVRYPGAAPVNVNSVPEGSTADNGTQPKEYAAALDGTGLIAMDHTRTTRMLLGSTVSAGWDTNPDNLGTSVSSGVYTLSPFLGVQTSTPRTQIIGQYQPTITRYTSSAYSTQALNVGSLRILSSINERWSMDGKAFGSYGQDSIRFVAPQQTVAVGGVPGTGASSAAYLPNAGTGTNLEGAFGIHYKESERDTLNFSVADTFSRFAGIRGNNSVATGTVGYDHGLSPRVALIAYGQGAYYYGAIHCTSLGGGVGLRWQIQQNSFLSVSGGPQYDTSVCKSQQGIAFSAAMGTRLTGRSQIYFLAGRQPTVSYLGGGLWQTSVSGGYQRQVGLKGTLSFDLSHVSSSTINTTGAYAGTYFDSVYSRRLAHGLSTSLSYRGYTGKSGGTGINRNIAVFSLSWTPEAGHILQ